MWTVESFRSDDHIILSAYILIPLCLSALSLWLQHEVGKSKIALPSMSVPIIVGLIVSGALNLVGGYGDSASDFHASKILLSDSVFYFALLPPIIFCSGFSLRRKDLIRHFDAVCLLAFVGSVISLLFMSVVLRYCSSTFLGIDITFVELLAFSALISSVDPVSALACFSKLKVDPNLYYLVLGESLFNDAICVTVFRSASKYIGLENPADGFVVTRSIVVEFVAVCTLSITFGYLVGCLASLFFKYSTSTQKGSHDRLVAVSILLTMIYLPFLAAEALELSGIVSIVAASISLRRYAIKNVSAATKDCASFAFSLVSHCAETASLVLLGLSVFSQRFSNYHWGFICCSTLAMIGGRILLTYPLLGLCNLLRAGKVRRKKLLSDSQREQGSETEIVAETDEKELSDALIKPETAHMVAISGLLRGAVSFSCAQIFPNTLGSAGLVVSTTTAIILASTFLVGSPVEHLLRFFGIPMRIKRRRFRQSTASLSPRLVDWEGKLLYPVLVRSPKRRHLTPRSSWKVTRSHHDQGSPHAIPEPEIVYSESDEEADTYSLSHPRTQDNFTTDDSSEEEYEAEYHTPISTEAGAVQDQWKEQSGLPSVV